MDNLRDIRIETSIDSTPQVDFLAFTSDGFVRIQLPTLVSNFPHLAPAGVGGVNFVVNDTINAIDPLVHSSAILAGGTAGNPNQIGIPFVGESGTYTAGTASYAINISGYDSINNQIAGVTIGPHHRLHAAGNHGGAIGGSSLEIKGGSYNVCVGGGGIGQGNHIDAGSNAAMIGGLNNAKTGSGNGTAMVGGNGNSDASSGSYNGFLSGQSNSITGAVQNAAVSGATNLVLQSFGFTFGTQAKVVAPAALTHAGRNITAQGDCQSFSVPVGVRTTDATLTNTSITSGGTNIQFDNHKTTAFVCRAMIVGIDEATKSICAYQADVAGYWDGTNLFFDDAAAAVTGPAASGERNMILITDNIGVAAVATLALTAGQLRIKVTGKAATNIRWAGSIDVSMTFF